MSNMPTQPVIKPVPVTAPSCVRRAGMLLLLLLLLRWGHVLLRKHIAAYPCRVKGRGRKGELEVTQAKLPVSMLARAREMHHKVAVCRHLKHLLR